MIVKIRTMDNGWVLYDIKKSIKSRPLTEEQYKFGMSENTPNCIEINEDVLYASDGEIFVKVINIDSGRVIVYTNQPVYLLNDEGKTIETIN